MPSFDVVSEVDMHEVSNAVDQANREISTRFDFKGTESGYALKDDSVLLSTETDFQLKQMRDILSLKLSKRGVETAALEIKEPIIAHKSAKQTIKLKQGIDTPSAKKIVKIIKDKKMKVQTTIQGEQVRVTGKKRDDLQDVISVLKECTLELPLQFENFRD
jgi:hypothetical protein